MIDNLATDNLKVDHSVIAQAILSATAEVKDFLADFYTETQIEASETLKGIVATLSIERLHLRRGLPTDQVTRIVNTSRETLKGFRDGTHRITGLTRTLPRITPESALNVFDESGLFDGLVDLEGEN
jgi:hypothetical protein